ncbi:monovalent cation/H+ antiporter subunit D family protein [Nesterenkonia aerolata]|uniref:Monovalent cation/H+ antiporter subunit D family protein n=1 Tax=Nesterenkonia aerolata TaxID=3074079 RepID=A0ABU2DNK6_9MICC|nr:monovalent cation/H+ antiporter subunit D family protein [Nesterenkonia sp. LY-0111]MDR8018079.1 monovalent cation/H+ antiporter subunit D family protein [Nesterenkonia sp. LY-0111]
MIEALAEFLPPLMPLLVGIPLLTGALCAALRQRRTWRHVGSLVTLGGIFVFALLMVIVTSQGVVLAHQVGLWNYGIAIPFVVDAIAALVLMIISILGIASVLFAMGTHEARARFYHPFVLILFAGISGALMTGDIFNLFVFIEVMLLPSYGLLAMMGAKLGANSARIYVTVNLLASTMLLAGIALVYGTAGSVNLAELHGAASEDPAVAIAAGVMLTALSIKAAVVPVHGWLTRTYPMTSPAVTALFSGIHTKVSIYAIYRLYSVLFDGDPSYLWVALVVTSLTMAIGVFGAMGEKTTRSILVFHMISQIGYILIGAGLFTLFGLTAAIFYLLHHMIVKASLFLSTGAIEETYGTGEISRLGGMLKREPLVAITFMVAALSLAGLPPFSGFVAKFTIIQATLEEGHIWVAVVAVIVSVFTLLSMLKIWTGVFMGPEPEGLESEALESQAKMHGKRYLRVEAQAETPTLSIGPPTATTTAVLEGRQAVKVPLKLIVPGALLAAVTIFFGLGAEVLMSLSEVAAEQLMDPSDYVEAVSGA